MNAETPEKKRGARSGLVQFVVYMPAKMHERLRRTAFKRRMNMSAIVRQAIGEHLGTPAGKR